MPWKEVAVDDAEDRDRRLSDALRAYTTAEPRPGLERRVLARVGAEGQAAHIRPASWAKASAALFALLIIGVMLLPVSRRPSNLVSTARLAPRAAPPVVRQPVRLEHTARARQARYRPARHTSPVTACNRPLLQRPLSAEERLMLWSASLPQTPLRKGFGNNDGIQPLEISKLRVDPLAQ